MVGGLDENHKVFRSDVEVENNINPTSEKKFEQIWKKSSKIGKSGLVVAVAIGFFPYVGYCALTKGIPALARKTFKHIIEPAGKTLYKIAKAVFYTFPIFVYNEAVIPIAKFVKNVAAALFVDFLYKKVLVTFGGGLKKIANWTYDNILCPIKDTICKVAEALLAIPKLIYKKVLVPIGETIKSIADWTFENILRPVKDTVCKLAKAIFKTFPAFVYHKILIPLGKMIQSIANWTLDNVVRPIKDAICALAKAIFVTFLYRKILVPIGSGIKAFANWTFENVLCPLKDGICKVAKAIFKTFPAFIYHKILVPIRNGIKTFANWTFENVLCPLKDGICKAAKAIFVTFLCQGILVPAGKGVKMIADWTYEKILSPIGRTIASIFTAIFKTLPRFVYDKGIHPVAEKIKARRAYTKEHYIDPAKAAITNFFSESIPALINEVSSRLRNKAV